MRRIAPARREVELVQARALSPSVRELVFEARDDQPFDYEPGQWFKFYLDGSGLARDYSIAAAPHDGRLVIAVTRVESGPGSMMLHSMPLGTRLWVHGPNGLFVRDEPLWAQPALYVGTGTGLAPLRSMLLAELARGGQAPQVLLFGCRTEDEVLYRDELEALAGRHPRFSYQVTLSRGSNAWTGRTGWVQAHLAEALRGMASPHVFICGLSAMVQDVRGKLKAELGLDRRFVHSERYD
jgi:CDP-4-dehydro-6-deoxyglucose reductase, E3